MSQADSSVVDPAAQCARSLRMTRHDTGFVELFFRGPLQKTLQGGGKFFENEESIEVQQPGERARVDAIAEFLEDGDRIQATDDDRPEPARSDRQPSAARKEWPNDCGLSCPSAVRSNLGGHRHFGEMGNQYKHDAQASVLRRK